MCCSWMFGEFMCKMYVFIQSLSNSASIVILVLICTERYFAILYPITCKQILTNLRLKVRKVTYCGNFVTIYNFFYFSLLFSQSGAPAFYTVPQSSIGETLLQLQRKTAAKLFASSTGRNLTQNFLISYILYFYTSFHWQSFR